MANGQPLILGTFNSASATTSLVATAITGSANQAALIGFGPKAGIGLLGRALPLGPNLLSSETGVVGAAPTTGVFGQSDGGIVEDENGNILVASTGVAGRSGNHGVGVHGVASAGFGVLGQDASGTGVLGKSASGTGVSGVSTSGAGVSGHSPASVGVRGESTTSQGVLGRSTSSAGVAGISTTFDGVFGRSTQGVGVHGLSSVSIGIYGSTVAQPGVRGDSNDYYGVFGTSSNGMACMAGRQAAMPAYRATAQARAACTAAR